MSCDLFFTLLFCQAVTATLHCTTRSGILTASLFFFFESHRSFLVWCVMCSSLLFSYWKAFRSDFITILWTDLPVKSNIVNMPQVIESRYTIESQLIALLTRLFPGQYRVEVSWSADVRQSGRKAFSKGAMSDWLTVYIHSFGEVNTSSRHRDLWPRFDFKILFFHTLHCSVYFWHLLTHLGRDRFL
jgi:hypothetical protein